MSAVNQIFLMEEKWDSIMITNEKSISLGRVNLKRYCSTTLEYLSKFKYIFEPVCIFLVLCYVSLNLKPELNRVSDCKILSKGFENL